MGTLSGAARPTLRLQQPQFEVLSLPLVHKHRLLPRSGIRECVDIHRANRDLFCVWKQSAPILLWLHDRQRSSAGCMRCCEDVAEEMQG